MITLSSTVGCLLISDKTLPVTEEDRYEDYIRFLERRDSNAEEQFWRTYLQGIEEPTLLPFIRATSTSTKRPSCVSIFTVCFLSATGFFLPQRDMPVILPKAAKADSMPMFQTNFRRAGELAGVLLSLISINFDAYIIGEVMVVKRDRV